MNKLTKEFLSLHRHGVSIPAVRPFRDTLRVGVSV
jgi:hypothetical protein